MINYRVSIFALAITTLAACGGSQMYVPLFRAATSGAQAVARASQQNAITKGDVAGCYTAGAFIGALGAVDEALDAWTQDPPKQTIPAIEVDASACYKLNPTGAVITVDVKDMVATILPPVLRVAGVIVAATDIDCKPREIVRAVLRYLEETADALVSEFATPDGIVKIGSVEIAPCE